MRENYNRFLFRDLRRARLTSSIRPVECALRKSYEIHFLKSNRVIKPQQCRGLWRVVQGVNLPKLSMDQSALMDQDLHSRPRQLIELRMEHADLDDLIDKVCAAPALDELALKRLKKRRLILRDQIARIEAELDPPEPA
jgi:hypothetical protein